MKHDQQCSCAYCEKYKECCTTDKEFWAKYEKRVKELIVDEASYKNLKPLKGFNSPETYVWDGKC